jgi:aerobic carbon-monoxide dehydrogenase medium subunit
VIPAAFAYERATSVEDALGLLARHGADAKVIAGGQSLLPLMKLRLARPERLIDIGRLDALRGIRTLPDGRLAVGALTTYAELLASPVIRLALLADALPHIGDIQVRNRGTIGGSIAHADPAADVPALLLALGAEVVATSSDRGERSIGVDDFFLGPFATALEPDELLTEIRLPAPSGSHGSGYRRLEQQASGFAIVGVAVVIGQAGATPSGEASLDDVRVAVTGVGDTPYRARSVEDALKGTSPDMAGVDEALRSITDGVTVQSDIHANREYRAAMTTVMARRALEAARARLFE